MPSALKPRLRSYLEKHYKANPAGILFTNRRSMKRESLVQYVLKPILQKLGIPEKRLGLHGFRHGLATELADSSVPLPVLQQQLRHADVRTTLRIYTRVIPESQRKQWSRPFGSGFPEVLLPLVVVHDSERHHAFEIDLAVAVSLDDDRADAGEFQALQDNVFSVTPKRAAMSVVGMPSSTRARKASNSSAGCICSRTALSARLSSSALALSPRISHLTG
jgi:Phage integrase family